ncbi:hypothetical protein [uncultured Thiothrix sp.]|uniref:hypothetical protein n=1 Tax=uncultured Thiothrix sp. TaxID=223185 RepID=UPI00261A0C5F|nr:hypothetical protein [uncultured Thiothrix sp.]
MKLTKTNLALAAIFFCLSSASVFAAGTTSQAAATEVAPEVLETANVTDEAADAVDTTNPEMDLAELQAEIRIACEEFATDEKVAEEKVPEFVDACVAENMPAEETDSIETVDSGVPALEEAEPEATTAAAQPIVTGQATTQE